MTDEHAIDDVHKFPEAEEEAQGPKPCKLCGEPTENDGGICDEEDCQAAKETEGGRGKRIVYPEDRIPLAVHQSAGGAYVPDPQVKRQVEEHYARKEAMGLGKREKGLGKGKEGILRHHKRE